MELSKICLEITKTAIFLHQEYLTGWELIRLLTFLESGRCWLWDTRNPSNTSIPIWLDNDWRLFQSLRPAHCMAYMTAIQCASSQLWWTMRCTRPASGCQARPAPGHGARQRASAGGLTGCGSTAQMPAHPQVCELYREV